MGYACDVATFDSNSSKFSTWRMIFVIAVYPLEDFSFCTKFLLGKKPWRIVEFLSILHLWRTSDNFWKFYFSVDFAFFCFDPWCVRFLAELSENHHVYRTSRRETLAVTTHVCPTATFNMLSEIHGLRCNNCSKYCQHDLLRHKVGETKYLSFSINIYISRCTYSWGVWTK